MFATSHGDHAIRIFSLATNKVIAVLTGHARTPWTLSFHRQNPHLLVSGCLNGELRLWDIRLRACVRSAILGTDRYLPSISTPARKLLAEYKFNAIRGRGWADVNHWVCTCRFQAEDVPYVRISDLELCAVYRVTSACFHPDSSIVAAACGKDLYFWDVSKDEPPVNKLETTIGFLCRKNTFHSSKRCGFSFRGTLTSKAKNRLRSR